MRKNHSKTFFFLLLLFYMEKFIFFKKTHLEKKIQKQEFCEIFNRTPAVTASTNLCHAMYTNAYLKICQHLHFLKREILAQVFSCRFCKTF